MKITIITVCLDSEKTIERTINSVISQSCFKDIEYIIYDGDSSDNTKKIVQKYSSKIDKIVIKKDHSVTDAINNSIGFASTKIIGFLNADDYFYDKACVHEILDTFKKNEIDAVYGDMQYIFNDSFKSRFWKSTDYYDGAFLKGWSLPFPTFYFKKKLIYKYGGFNNKFKFCDDYELVYRLIFQHKIKIKRINKTLINFNANGRSSNLFSRVRSAIDIYKLLKLNHKIHLIPFLYHRYSLKIKEFFK